MALGAGKFLILGGNSIINQTKGEKVALVPQAINGTPTNVDLSSALMTENPTLLAEANEAVTNGAGKANYTVQVSAVLSVPDGFAGGNILVHNAFGGDNIGGQVNRFAIPANASGSPRIDTINFSYSSIKKADLNKIDNIAISHTGADPMVEISAEISCAVGSAQFLAA